MSDPSDAEYSDTETKSSHHHAKHKHKRYSDPEDDRSLVTVKDIVHAIRRLREPGGATFTMVKNYIAAEGKFAGVSAKRLEKQVKLAMHRAIDDGKLSRVKSGLRFLLTALVSGRGHTPERRGRRSSGRRRGRRHRGKSRRRKSRRRKSRSRRGKSRSKSRRRRKSHSRSRRRRHKSRRHR